MSSLCIKIINYSDNFNDLCNNFELLQDLENAFQKKNIKEFKSILRLILNNSNNHFRLQLFDKKIEQVLLFFFKNIKITIPNSDIFLICQRNKRILLLLLKNNIITIDQFVLQYILNDESYYRFFYPEIKPHLNDEQQKQIEEELLKIDNDIFNTFENKREIGENDSYISSYQK